MHQMTFWKFVLFAVVGAGFSVFGDNTQIPKTSFSCDGRTSGYYADVSTGCQVYHMCDGLGRQFTYRCPSKTLFQQRMLICDHWYMVNCSKAEEDYSANLLIGQRGRAFVEDLQYHRTPRPDLVDPSNLNYNAYQTSQINIKSTKNVVGAEEDDADANNSTDEPKYFPPSHWSTEFSAQSSTLAPSKRQETDSDVPKFMKQKFYKTSYSTGSRFLNADGQPKLDNSVKNPTNRSGINRNPVPRPSTINNETNKASHSLPNGVNFPSSFKATTPVYPKHIDIDLSKFTEFGSPEEENVSNEAIVNFPSKFKATTPVYPKSVETDSARLSEFDLPINGENVGKVLVNFASNFKATTPVYPIQVDFDPSKISEFDVPIENANMEIPLVNFASNFKATTPVYPKTVEIDVSKFSGSEEVPPEPNNENSGAVNFPSNFTATTPVYPQHVDVDLSKFSEPVELPEENTVNNETVNFGSNFKATTPVYPQSVEATSPIPEEFGLLPPLPAGESAVKVNEAIDNNGQVNFASNFQATTPVYPKSVEPTSPDPSDAGLLAPEQAAQPVEAFQPSIDFEPPSFDKTFRRRIDEEDPSVTGNTFSSKQLTEFMLTIKPEQLKDLKQMWHIPDYDFPLDTASRPSYESDFSSFQAIPKDVRSR